MRTVPTVDAGGVVGDEGVIESLQPAVSKNTNATEARALMSTAYAWTARLRVT